MPSDPASPMLKYYLNFVGGAAEQLLEQSVLASGGVVQLSSPQEGCGHQGVSIAVTLT